MNVDTWTTDILMALPDPDLEADVRKWLELDIIPCWLSSLAASTAPVSWITSRLWLLLRLKRGKRKYFSFIGNCPHISFEKDQSLNRNWSFVKNLSEFNKWSFWENHWYLKNENYTVILQTCSIPRDNFTAAMCIVSYQTESISASVWTYFM